MPSDRMTERERFLALMEYQPLDRLPNHEVGVWEQTKDRWELEGLNIHNLTWDWFTGCEYFDMDAREYIPVNYDMMPPFEEQTPEALMEAVRPDVHVKGGDYTEEQLPEAALVRSYGGEVKIVPQVSGRSTSAIIEKAKEGA